MLKSLATIAGSAVVLGSEIASPPLRPRRPRRLSAIRSRHKARAL
jgi:hypothetical protein